MNRKHEVLLVIDGFVNLTIGLLLLLFPFGMASWLGVPEPEDHFYPSILGAVIFGIGVALLVERYGFSRNIRGLGLGGAIAINFSGASALLIWLVTASLALPLRGNLVLWGIVVAVFVIGISEVVTGSWRY